MAGLKEMQCAVTRPAAGTTPAVVTLTATIKKGVEVDTREFEVTVVPWTNQEAISIDLSELSYETILGSNTSEAQVISNLSLPTTGKMGTSIAWASNNEAIVSTDEATLGVVTRPSYSTGNLTITLTATVEVNGESQTKEFTITVLKKDQTPEEELQAYVDSVAVEDILGTNTSYMEVEFALSLPLTGPSGSGISNSWVSSNELIIDANGNVTRPSSSEGYQTVTLTLTASKLSAEATKVFTVRVKPL